MAGRKKKSAPSLQGAISCSPEVIKNASELFDQASDPTRANILMVLDEESMTVGHLADEIGITRSALSHHLVQMRLRGVVDVVRYGKASIYDLTKEGRKLARVVQLAALVQPGMEGS